jgi:hypothetical protein
MGVRWWPAASERRGQPPPRPDSGRPTMTMWSMMASATAAACCLLSLATSARHCILPRSLRVSSLSMPRYSFLRCRSTFDILLNARGEGEESEGGGGGGGDAEPSTPAGPALEQCMQQAGRGV